MQSYEDEVYLKTTKLADEIISQLPDFCRRYFTHLKGKSPRTRLQYAYDMKRFFDYIAVQPGFRETPLRSMRASEILDQMQLEDIQEYLDTLEYQTNAEKRSSASSRARKASSLRSFWSYYYKIGEIRRDMAPLIDVPDIPQHPVIAMDGSQVQRLLDTVKSDAGLTSREMAFHSRIVQRDFAIMMTLLGTGIRVSELVGIDIDDIDFEEASIIVKRKGGDYDEVFFPLETETALQSYINEGRDLLSPPPEEKALFISLQHERMSVRSVQVMVKKYSQRAGLNVKITPHKCRSTFATNILRETGDIRTVQTALHHQNIQTTTKYLQTDREQKRRAALKSATLFQNESN